MSAYDELAELCGLKNPIGHDLIVAAGAEIKRLRALSPPPEPTEAQIEAVLNAYHDMGVEGAWPQKARNMMRAALRAMPLQDGAVTQDKRGNQK